MRKLTDGHDNRALSLANSYPKSVVFLFVGIYVGIFEN